MSSQTPQPTDPISTGLRRTLTERVRDRVAAAGARLDGPAKSAAPKAKRPRTNTLAAAASSSNGSADPEHDAQSLRRVYGEMRSKYQRYRKETGKSSVPALREAVHAFKKGPSLTSLVGVATFLDERGLLPW
jgi:hypothetical protein